MSTYNLFDDPLLTEPGIYREISGSRIPGGSEDVMLDLAIRQLVKNFQTKLKELKTEGNAKPSSRL